MYGNRRYNEDVEPYSLFKIFEHNIDGFDKTEKGKEPGGDQMGVAEFDQCYRMQQLCS